MCHTIELLQDRQVKEDIAVVNFEYVSSLFISYLTINKTSNRRYEGTATYKELYLKDCFQRKSKRVLFTYKLRVVYEQELNRMTGRKTHVRHLN